MILKTDQGGEQLVVETPDERVGVRRYRLGVAREGRPDSLRDQVHTITEIVVLR